MYVQLTSFIPIYWPCNEIWLISLTPSDRFFIHLEIWFAVILCFLCKIVFTYTSEWFDNVYSNRFWIIHTFFIHVYYGWIFIRQFLASISDFRAPSNSRCTDLRWGDDGIGYLAWVCRCRTCWFGFFIVAICLMIVWESDALNSAWAVIRIFEEMFHNKWCCSFLCRDTICSEFVFCVCWSYSQYAFKNSPFLFAFLFFFCFVSVWMKIFVIGNSSPSLSLFY